MQFVVAGSPVPKGRPRFTVRGGSVKTYTPQKTEDYERKVKHTAAYVMRSEPFACAVEVRIMAYLEVPKSWSKKKRDSALRGEIYPSNKNDVDNLAKAACDAMNGIVYVDDGLIVDLAVGKRYSAEPRMEISVLPAVAVSF